MGEEFQLEQKVRGSKNKLKHICGLDPSVDCQAGPVLVHGFIHNVSFLKIEIRCLLVPE